MLNNKDVSQLADKSSKNSAYISAEERHNLIEKEAYFCAYARGFIKGDALTDWLEAERKIDSANTVKTSKDFS